MKNKTSELDLLVAELLSLPAGRRRLKHKDKIKLLEYAGSFANLWQLLQVRENDKLQRANETNRGNVPGQPYGPVSLHKPDGIIESNRQSVARELNEPSELKLLRLIMSQTDMGELLAKAKQWRRQGIGVVSILDARFPASLNNSSTSISLLYYQGENLSLLSHISAAVVGSRALTAYGHKATAVLVENICRKGYCLVSGAAEGADTVAHQAAIDCAGETIAVLGCGVDIAYPRQNRKLLRQISERGLVISEFKPGTPPVARNFPARNRIIAALADFVVVTSAKTKSGSLITAQMADRQGRQVYAVPGSIFDSTQKGCHSLIKDGIAKIVTDLTMPEIQKASDLRTLAELRPQADSTRTIVAKALTNPELPETGAGGTTVESRQKQITEVVDASPATDRQIQLTFTPHHQNKNEMKILQFLTTGTKTLEQIYQSLDLSISETAQILTKLEMTNQVNMRRGHYELSCPDLYKE